MDSSFFSSFCLGMFRNADHVLEALASLGLRKDFDDDAFKVVGVVQTRRIKGLSQVR